MRNCVLQGYMEVVLRIKWFNEVAVILFISEFIMHKNNYC